MTSRTPQFWLPGRKPGMSPCPPVGSSSCRSDGSHRLTASRLRFAAAAAVEGFRCCGVLAFLRVGPLSPTPLNPKTPAALDRFRITTCLESWPLVRFSSADSFTWWRHASRLPFDWGWLGCVTLSVGKGWMNKQGDVEESRCLFRSHPESLLCKIVGFPLLCAGQVGWFSSRRLRLLRDREQTVW